MKLSFKLTGVEQLAREMKRVEKRVTAELAAALEHEAKALLEQANQVAPRESGEMVRSGVVSSDVQPAKGTVEVAVAYLDEKAAAVHEGFHGGKDSEGVLPGEKWFEQTLNAFEPGFQRRIAARLQRVTGGGS